MVRRALAMAAGEQYFRLALQFALIVAVSRLLTPTEIGVSVIGTGILAIALALREFASPDFLIQREEVLRDDIRSSFTVLFLLTGLITIAIVILAPWFATLYGEDRLAGFLRLVAVAALIETIPKPIKGLLQRDMAFGTLAFIHTTTSMVSAAATVLLVLAGFSFMSMAWAAVAAAGTTTVLSFYFRPDLSSFVPAFKSWRTVLAFGGYNGASYVIHQAYETLPQLVLGGILPASAVGLYSRAVMVSRIPDLIFLTSVTTVAFPALAAENRNGGSVKKPYLLALGYITVFYWPAQVLIALLAYPVVSLLLGPQWLAVAPLLQVIAIAYLAWFPVGLAVAVLLAVGANRDRVLVHLVARPVCAVVLCSAAYFGTMAIAMSHLLAMPYMMVVTLYFVRRNISFRWGEVWAVLWRSAVVAAGTAAGPICVLALSGSGFDLSMAATVVAVLLAAAGWFGGAVVTRHPVLLELGKAAEAIVQAAFVGGRRARIMSRGARAGRWDRSGI